jgi:hypothetical protein
MRHLVTSFLLVLAGCATVAPATTASTSADARAVHTATADQLLASLTRGPCNGACPTYSVRVMADGAVEFEGQRFTSTKGRAVDRLTAQQLAQLEEAFRTAGFDAMQASYRDPHVADLAIITVTHGGKTVTHSTGDAQPALKALEDRLDEVIGTSRWVVGPTM